MSEFEFGPSSISTLFFVPDFIKSQLDGKESDENKSVSSLSINNYSLRDHHSKTLSINRKSVSDYETMAFVALRDIIKISNDELSKLYNYNKREYNTFQAVIKNSNINYNHLINHDQVTILYQFFARVSSKDSWVEVCYDLGFGKYFTSDNIEKLYDDVLNLQIRAKDEHLFEVRFFMQLIIYYWDNTNNINITDNCSYFWVRSLSQIIQFISGLAVARNIEIYCLLTHKWINATITKINKSEHQLYAQYLDGSNKHQWLSFFSSRVAPIGFKYFYVPNVKKRNNVPCIVSVVDEQLNSYSTTNVQLQARDPGNTNFVQTHTQTLTTNEMLTGRAPENGLIPREGWSYRAINNNRVGPVPLGVLFIRCAEGQINQNTPVYHQQYGVTTLNKLPEITDAFRKHVKKCKMKIDAEYVASSSSITNQREQLSIFSSSNSPFNPNLNRNNHMFGINVVNNNHHNNSNVFIPESDINRFPYRH